MKADSKRFKRVTASNGKNIWVLSSHCQANLEADKKLLKLCVSTSKTLTASNRQSSAYR